MTEPFIRDLLDDLREATEQSTYTLTTVSRGLWLMDIMPDTRRDLAARVKANNELLARVREAMTG